MKIITQFLRDVNWGQLDYFLVDMPPGTGDAQLSLVQATHGAWRGHRHHAAAGGGGRCAARREDVRARCRAGAGHRREHVVVRESRDRQADRACSVTAGAQRLADETRLPLLAQVPLDPRIQEGGDTGRPIIVAEPEAKASKAIRALAEVVVARMDARWGVGAG